MISTQFGTPMGGIWDVVKTAVNPVAMTKKSYQATKAVTQKSAQMTKQVATTGGKVLYKASVVPLKVGAKVIYKAHAIPTQWLAIKPTMWLADKAMSPVRSRVQTLVKRRAAKIAMDKRKSTTPTPQEIAEARAWTKHKLTYDGPAGVPTPHGKILSYFAGSEYRVPMYTSVGQLGVAPAVAAAAVPLLVALCSALLAKYSKSGEAPANPKADAAANTAEPIAPGTVDLQPVQNAVDEANASAAIDAGADGDAVVDAAGGKPGLMKRSGTSTKSMLPAGITKKHLMIGGAVLGGIVLISMFKPSRAA